MPPAISNKRKKGGQPGNQNARTHGFYSKFLEPGEGRNVEKAAKLDGVDQEIALLRQKIKSLLAKDPHNDSAIMQAFSALNSLVRTKLSLESHQRLKLDKAVEYILRDTAALVGILPESANQPRHGSRPDSAEAGSLSTNESHPA